MLAAPLAKARDITKHTAEMYRAPRRTLPVEAAALHLRNEKDVWQQELAPMMLEPMNLLASRDYRGIIFVGSARSSKTFSIVLGGLCYVVTCDPGDALIVHISQDTARDFSRGDLDRCIRHSPELSARLSPRARDDNTFDKFFRSGMVVKLGWPSVSQLSAKTIRYVFLTDYDRPENRDDVDGEGSLWDQAYKRIETYMSRGKCVAESSPGEDLLDRNWKPSTPHEAPPVKGILSLYNRGTRARWYWGCVHCNHHFQAAPGLAPFNLPDTDQLEKMVMAADLMGLADEYAHVACPQCGGVHTQQEREEMNAHAAWLHEGQRFEAGAVVGDRLRTQVASYWLGGVAAAYQRWDAILLNYFQALQTFVKTGDEGPLRTKTLNDLAFPYLPRHVAKRRSADEFKERLEQRERGMVPEWVRFLTAAVDVQKNRFVAHVMGWGVGLESVLVDRFSIEVSKRTDEDRALAVNPAAYLEDWELLIDGVARKSYAIEGIEDFRIRPSLLLIDSGGIEGVTTRAYEFWRGLRRRGLSDLVQLLKGDPRLAAPRVVRAFPDTRNRSDRSAGSRGDVPVWMLNVNSLKDAVAGDLARDVPGPGYVHLSSWLDKSYFDQITAESKNNKGVWEKKSGQANEDWDLHVYNRAACIVLRAEKFDWQNPPEWALPLPDQAKNAKTTNKRSLAEIARGLNG